MLVGQLVCSRALLLTFVFSVLAGLCVEEFAFQFSFSMQNRTPLLNIDRSHVFAGAPSLPNHLAALKGFG